MSTETSSCTKCDGVGSIRGFEHIADGVCFACSGAGVVVIRSGKLTRTQRVARNQQRNAELAAIDPDLADAWHELGRRGSAAFKVAKTALHEAATFDDGLVAMRSAMEQAEA